MQFSRIRTVALRGIGVALFLWILLRMDLGEVLHSLLSVSALHLSIFLLLFAPIYLLKSWRWHVIVRANGIHETFAESNRVYLTSLFLGILTPGKLGEVAKVPALRRKGLSTARSIALILLDRLLDVTFLALLGLAGIWHILGPRVFLLCLAGSIGGCCALICILRRQWAMPLWTFLDLVWKRSVPLLMSTLANWIVYFVQLGILAQGFGLSLPATDFVSIMTLVGILSILPIAPAGLGTREAALLYFLSRHGFAAERIVAFSVTIFALTLLSTAVGGLLLYAFPARHAQK